MCEWWSVVGGLLLSSTRPLSLNLLDLGVSSMQLDEVGRGFSFRADGPLDMRMNRARGYSAAEWLAGADEGDIATVLREYGEERFARRIARAIVARRQVTPITGTPALSAMASSWGW